MKYTAHLSTGGTLDIELSEDREDRRFTPDGLLVDVNGIIINAKYLVALVPVFVADARTAPSEPSAVIVDGAGDRWELQPDGSYVLRDGGLQRTREESKRLYGIDYEE